jgi:uncharacterized membrane protein
MVKILLTLHIVAAIFLIGPLVAAGNGAARAARSGNATALRGTARMVTVYGWASLAVLVFGMSLVQGRDRGLGVEFGDTWVFTSLILFLVAFLLVVGVLRPTLKKAVSQAEAGRPTSDLAGRVGAVAGVASLIYVAVAVLMVYKP